MYLILSWISTSVVFNNVISELDFHFTDPTSRLSWFYLVPGYFLLFLAYIFIRKKTTHEFIEEAFSRKVWFSKSSFIDYTMFALLLIGLWELSFISFDLWTKNISAYLKNSKFNSNPWWPGLSESYFAKLIWTVLFAMVSDFGRYWAHRLQHFRPFWNFHAVHHSATVLNPLTVFRSHPIDESLTQAVKGFLLLSYSLLTLLVFGVESIDFVAQIILSLILVFAVTANFRHTMLWLPYPRWLSYIFVSPAMHQIHHSQYPKHKNKNLGIIFSIWDWMFGTIYIPTKIDKENLILGISQEEGYNPHSFISLFWVPWRKTYFQSIALIQLTTKLTIKKNLPTKKLKKL